MKKMNTLIEVLGYEFKEKTFICDQGYAMDGQMEIYHKMVGDIRLLFDIHYEQQMGEPFQLGKLSILKSLSPNRKTIAPYVNLTIENITIEDMNLIPVFEAQLIEAFKPFQK